MGIIARTKFGNCSVCSERETSVVKRGKKLLCLNCKRKIDTTKQMKQAREKQQVRTLGTFQKEQGIVDSIQELIIDLDRVASRYVRLAAMGKDHKVECYTCGARKDWKKIQCGHFIARQHLSVRWELANMKPQCTNCNVTLHGNLEQYTERLEKENKGITDYLQEQARVVASPTRGELKELLFDFQQKLKLVETKLSA